MENIKPESARLINLESYNETYDINEKIKCNVYGKNIKNKLYLIQRSEFDIEMHKNRFLLSTVYKFNCNEEFMGIFKEVQMHPVTGFVIHLDIHFLEDNQLIEMNLNVKIINKNLCKGLKDGGLLRSHRGNFVVKFLPKHAINIIEVDILKLDINESITTEGLNLQNVEFLTPGPIVSIVPPRTQRK